MASLRNSTTLGSAIAKERLAKGLTQKEVAALVPTFYGEERAYRRVESGERTPGRGAVIAILSSGLRIGESEKINDILALGGYSPLTHAEARKCGVSVVQTVVPPVAIPELPEPDVPIPSSEQKGLRSPALMVLCSVSVAAAIAAASQETILVLFSAILYGCLYVVSILLESTFDPVLDSRWPVASVVFGLVVVTSAAALAIDAWFARLGMVAALPVALSLFLVAAACQWVIAKSTLSEAVVVPMRFMAHTAQVAHLKNTVYFLIIVVLFWLPPFHSIMVLRREIHAGNTAWVKATLADRLLLGRDFVSFHPEWLWFACLFLVLLSLPMAVRLLENLKSDPRLNTYTALVYLRGVLYFLLVVTCLIWYSSAIAAISA
jgi:transcriptional regulator with XRE-family HTH domain